MTKTGKKKSLLRKQAPMRRVLLALLPCVAGSVYFFGWRSLAMIAVSCIIAFLVEYVFCKKRGEPVSEAAFVTAVLFALVMPPIVGWHVLIIGIIFAILFSKEVFGGFGRNIFNPALAGRCFVYICFPYALTGQWAPPAEGMLGALDQWSTVQSQEEIVTGATPMGDLKSGILIPASDVQTPQNWLEHIEDDSAEPIKISKIDLYKNLIIGRIPGTMGVTSALLITIGGIYLFWNKTASRAIILSVIITYAVWNIILTAAGVPRFYGAIAPVLGGGFLFGAFYMATDPVSSPKRTPSRIIYGMIIGTGTVVIRNFSIFNGGLMFSILLGNMFAPILDYAVDSYNKMKKQKAQAKPEQEDEKT